MTETVESDKANTKDQMDKARVRREAQRIKCPTCRSAVLEKLAAKS